LKLSRLVSSADVSSAASLSKALPSADVPSKALPSADVPSKALPSADVPSKALSSADVPSAASLSKALPSADVPSVVVLSAALPSADVPSKASLSVRSSAPGFNFFENPAPTSSASTPSAIDVERMDRNVLLGYLVANGQHIDINALRTFVKSVMPSTHS
jgi:hypothetical protein